MSKNSNKNLRGRELQVQTPLAVKRKVGSKLKAVPKPEGDKPVEWRCQRCKRVFVREHNFNNHVCRLSPGEIRKTDPLTQPAWEYYRLWMTAKKRATPSVDTFVHSRLYTAFVDFVVFARKVKLVAPDRFIRLMVAKDFQPQMWTMDGVYMQYLDYIDTELTPLERVEISIDTLFAHANKHDVDISCVFEHTDPDDLIKWLRSQKVSPWLLLNSKKFAWYYANVLTAGHRDVLNSMVRADYWFDKTKQDPELTKQLKAIISELGL